MRNIYLKDGLYRINRPGKVKGRYGTNQGNTTFEMALKIPGAIKKITRKRKQ